MKEIIVTFRIELGYGCNDRDFSILEDDWEALTKQDFNELLNDVAGEYLDWDFEEDENANDADKVTINYTIGNGYVNCGVKDSFDIETEEWSEMDAQERIEFVKEYYIDERVDITYTIAGASYDDLPDEETK